jgi:hypothetical protein
MPVHALRNEPDDLRALDSSCIASAAYDEDTGTLDLTFTTGRRYRYYDVSPGKARYLMDRAPSPGRYYNSGIKGQFTRRKLRS